jgi:hypothetical protein
MTLDASLVPTQLKDVNVVIEYGSGLVHVRVAFETGGVLIQGLGQVVAGFA